MAVKFSNFIFKKPLNMNYHDTTANTSFHLILLFVVEMLVPEDVF